MLRPDTSLLRESWERLSKALDTSLSKFSRENQKLTKMHLNSECGSKRRKETQLLDLLEAPLEI